MKQLYSIAFIILSLIFSSTLVAQVTVTSSDSLSCTDTCTTLTAHLIGDVPINSGITIDDVFETVPNPIGFTFNFYGNPYTQCLIGPNGNICFDLTQAGMFTNWMITAPLLGNATVYNTICGPWCDIDIVFGGTITYSTDGVAPNRKFVVTYCHDAMYNPTDCPGQYTTSQVIMYESTNIIEVHITHKTICTSWNGGYAIVGVQNATGTSATAAPGRDFPTTWTGIDEGWRFTPHDTGTGPYYLVSSIAYAPVPFDSSSIYWYDATTNTYLGTGATIHVCPRSLTTYKAGALGCADTSFGFYTVTPGGLITMTTSFNNPSYCGALDGSISLFGLTPGLTDTVHYEIGGVPQPPIIASVSASGSIVLTGLAAGTYSNIIVAQPSGCNSSPATITLTNPPVTITVSSSNPTLCGANDGSISVNGLKPGFLDTINYELGGVLQTPVSGPVSAGGSILITGLCAGTYGNIIASQLGCTSAPAGPVVLTNPTISITTVNFTNPSSCAACDGTVTLTGLYPGKMFTVNYTKDGVAQSPLTLSSNASGTITLTGLCAGAPPMFPGGSVYGNFVASFTDCSSCATPPAGPVTLVAPPAPPASIVASTDATECGVCNGTLTIKNIPPFSLDSVFYSMNGTVQTPFITIAYPDSSVDLSELCAGAYSGFTIDVGQCVYNVGGIANISQPSILDSFTQATHWGCNGDTVFFQNYSSTPGPLYYIWSFGDGATDTTRNPEHIYAQGQYTVTLTATNIHCETTFTLSDSLIHPLVAAFTDSPSIICQGNPISFTNNTSVLSTPPLSYLWNFGDGYKDNSINPAHTYINSGTYSVMLVASNFIPCNDTVTSLVYVDSTGPVTIGVTDSVFCRSNYVTFSGYFTSIGNTGFTWNFGDGDSVVNTNPVAHAFDGTGTYTVTLTSKYRVCATADTSRKVTIFQQPVLSMVADTTICLGSVPLTLADVNNAGIPGATWKWNTGQTSPAIEITTAGTYWLRVNISGCETTDTIVVQNDCYMDVPNAFTPNNDGLNDYFFPRLKLTKGLTSFKMDIYNRWGELIFESTSLDGTGWDGRLNGVDQPEGVYVFLIDATFLDGQKEHRQGNVTLLR